LAFYATTTGNETDPRRASVFGRLDPNQYLSFAANRSYISANSILSRPKRRAIDWCRQTIGETLFNAPHAAALEHREKWA
jgi:hypothetical protein